MRSTLVAVMLAAVACKGGKGGADSVPLAGSPAGTPSGTASGTPAGSTATTCGDGAVDVGEECDYGPDNGPDNACLADCTINPDLTLVLDAAALAQGVDGIAVSDVSVLGAGAWRATPSEDTNGDGFDKFELYAGPEAPWMDMLRGVTVADLTSISYSTHKSGPEGSGDFYLVIYTKPDGVDDQGWYGYRLVGEPLYSRQLDAPGGQWNVWTTDPGPNQLVFYDSQKAGLAGFYTAPTLSELQADAAWDWSTVSYAASPTALDYGSEELHYLSIQTAGPWESTFSGAIDAIHVELASGRQMTIDLEP